MGEVQRLENVDELGALIRGDVIESLLGYVGHGEEKDTAAFHRISSRGQFEFVIPAESRGPYIVMHRAYREFIRVENGKILLHEDKSVTQSYNPEDSRYEELDKTIQMAGLR